MKKYVFFQGKFIALNIIEQSVHGLLFLKIYSIVFYTLFISVNPSFEATLEEAFVEGFEG